MSETTARPGQGRFVAPVEETPVAAVDRVDESAPSTSVWGDAWRTLRRRPLFIVASLIVLLLVVVAIRPQLFTSTDPAFCSLDNSLGGSTAGHLFGFDRQGCDIYSRVVYGARASIIVGIVATAVSVVVGGVLGALAGYYGGWLDAIISRVSDIFFAVPLLLAAITGMQAFDQRTAVVVALVLAAFGWPQVARLMRSSVLSVRNAEYVTAATALGSSKLANLGRHVLPNAIAPVIVIATINLGVYIAAEATLSFLGIGLSQSVISWGGDINKAQTSLRQNANVLLYPAGALSLTVLSFIMLGDAVRDALDPKGRTR